MFIVCLLSDEFWTLPLSNFPWQLHPILWRHMKPARPMNALLPSPPDQRSCGFSLSPTKGTAPEGSRSPMWHMMVSAMKLGLPLEKALLGRSISALNRINFWANWWITDQHACPESQARSGQRTLLTHKCQILNWHLGTLTTGMKRCFRK